MFPADLLAKGSRGPTDAERKDEALQEYQRCMSIGAQGGIQAVLLYVWEEQSGSSLRGGSPKLAQENCIADTLNLPRYQDLDDIVLDDGGRLVQVSSPYLDVNGGVPRERHVAMSWTRDYLFERAEFFKSVTKGKKLRIASLVRSRDDQDGLSGVKKFYYRVKGRLKKVFRKRRSFADCSHNSVCSTHLTGAAVDISLRGLTKKEQVLLSERLLEDREQGRILVIHEKKGNHFHVFVIPPEYVPLRAEQRTTENAYRLPFTIFPEPLLSGDVSEDVPLYLSPQESKEDPICTPLQNSFNPSVL